MKKEKPRKNKKCTFSDAPSWLNRRKRKAYEEKKRAARYEAALIEKMANYDLFL